MKALLGKQSWENNPNTMYSAVLSLALARNFYIIWQILFA